VARAADLEVFVLAAIVAIAVPVVMAAWRRTPPRLGGLEVVVGAAVVVVLDDELTHALPSPLVRHAWWAAVGVVVVAMAGRGAVRLPTSPGRVPLILLIVLAQLAGVWAGVPETSAAVIAAGLVGGATVVAALRGVVVRTSGSFALVALPVAATLVGAVGSPIPTVGGLLASALLVISGVTAARRRSLSRARTAGAVATQLAAAMTAARLVAVRPDWGSAAIGVVATLALSQLGARVLAAAPHGRA
jgi:hypothetical protein